MAEEKNYLRIDGKVGELWRSLIRPRNQLSLRTKLSWLLPGLLTAAVIVYCRILARKRLLWSDELLSWYPVSSSFGSMLGATTDTLNSAPPLYFVAGWFWVHLFGGSAVALRLFSAGATAAALLVMFAVLRRVYGALPSILALTVIAVDLHLLSQSEQARFHTLFVAELTLVLLLQQRLLASRVPSFSSLMFNTVVHAFMMLTSYIAFFYSSALLGAVVIVSALRRRNPLRICFSIVASWVVLLPWIPVLLRHMEMSKLSWIPVANTKILRSYFEGYLNAEGRWLIEILIVFAGVALLLRICFGGRRHWKGSRGGELSLLITGLALLVVPFVLYTISSRPGASSIFVERYMLGSLFGWAILLAHFGHRAFLVRHRTGRRPVSVALVTAQVIMSLVFLGSNIRRMIRVARHVPVARVARDLAAELPGEEPIVVEHIHEFLSWHFYSPRRSRYRFVVDPEVGTKEMAGGPLNHAIMGALRRRFPAQFQEVMPTDEFLRGASSFYVRHIPGYQWSVMRLQSNPHFTIEAMPDSLLHVRRVAD